MSDYNLLKIPTILERHYRKVGSVLISSSAEKWYAPTRITITSIIARLEIAPIGSPAIFGIKRDGILIDSISISSNSRVSSTYTTPIHVDKNSYISIDIIGMGSTTKGSDLTITFTYIRN